MLPRLLATVLIAGLTLGCPMIEELDKSGAEMDKYSPSAQRALKEKKAAEAAKADGSTVASAGDKAGSAAASVRDSAANWWANARSITSGEKNPDLVRCALPGGRTEFMRKHDCEMRSGVGKP